MALDPLIGGALIAGASSLLSGLFGTSSQNRSINKQIKAQKEENALARAHNLQLAQQQNQWNIDQWNREVQYNDPAAQMARFKAAGLNPNLIYSQSNTAPQLSGSLTSGAPAVPADMSALGNKKSPISSVFDAIKENPFLYEQLRSMRLDNENKEIGLNEEKYQQDIRRFVRRLNYSPESLNSLLNYGAGNDEWQNDEGVNPMYNNPDVRMYLMDYYKYHRQFKIDKDTEDAIVDSIIADANIKESEAQKARETLKSTIGAINKNNVNNIDFSEIERDLNLGKGALSLIKLLVEILK